MPTNWKDAGNQKRLIAAMLAAAEASGNKISMPLVAKYFEQDATTGSIIFQLRDARQMANEMRKKHDGILPRVSTPKKRKGKNVVSDDEEDTPNKQKKPRGKAAGKANKVEELDVKGEDNGDGDELELEL
ncbi:MAG: hypothetical protein M1820_002648 [Bogoriella megaspora]|nr:MAG: hypothetical protein M1820_002648 [Bogoriella megaspora]